MLEISLIRVRTAAPYLVGICGSCDKTGVGENSDPRVACPITLPAKRDPVAPGGEEESSTSIR